MSKRETECSPSRPCYASASEFIERFAECWRAIGQPDTRRMYVAIAIDTPEFDAAPESVLGMSVFEMESPINAKNVAIVTSYDGWTETPAKFAAEWTDLIDA